MDRPGFFFCICPDAALLRSWMESELLKPLIEQAKQSGPSLMGGLMPASSAAPDIQTFWADEGLDRRFWDALTLLGMDGRQRILIVRGAHQLSAEIWKKLSASLATPRPGVLPVFCMECIFLVNNPPLTGAKSGTRQTKPAPLKAFTLFFPLYFPLSAS